MDRIEFWFALGLLFMRPSSLTASLQAIGNLPTGNLEVQFVTRQAGWCRTTHDLYATTDGGRTWHQLLKPYSEKAEQLARFQFLNLTNGYIQLSSGRTYWTRDGGATWRPAPTPEGSQLRRLLIVDSQFLNEQVGWLLCQKPVQEDTSRESIRYRIAGTHSVYIPALFRTDNGGHSWREQSYPDLKGLPHRLEFADATHGISVEWNQILYTRDGGATWLKGEYCAATNRERLRRAEMGTGIFEATSAQLLDDQAGWWTVEGDLFHTTNGGATWCALPSIRWHGSDVQVNRIRFASRSHGWAIPTQGERNPDATPVFETHNGGKSWEALSTGQMVNGITIARDGTIYFWDRNRLYRLVE